MITTEASNLLQLHWAKRYREIGLALMFQGWAGRVGWSGGLPDTRRPTITPPFTADLVLQARNALE